MAAVWYCAVGGGYEPVVQMSQVDSYGRGSPFPVTPHSEQPECRRLTPSEIQESYSSARINFLLARARWLPGPDLLYLNDIRKFESRTSRRSLSGRFDPLTLGMGLRTEYGF